MTTSYVLLKIQPGMDRNVLHVVKKLAQVKTVETLYGEYDMLIKVDVETENGGLKFEVVAKTNKDTAQ